MKFNFDEVIERRGTASFKWDATGQFYGSDDLLPMWVADMDFACAPAVLDAVQHRAAHPVYGYTVRQQPYFDAVMGWFRRRYGFDVRQEHLVFSPPGVIYAMYVVLKLITREGDKVLIPMPNYDPLFDMVGKSGRTLVESPLVDVDGTVTFDFADLERKLSTRDIKVMMLSSPHNPTGRVWTREELEHLAGLCVRYDVFMMIDEIHCDFVPKGRHVAFGTLGEEVLQKSMVCYSANKGFNLGGLGMATIVLADEKLRAAFVEEMLIAQTRLDNVFGAEALIAAYNHGEEWLDAAIAYVEENKRYLGDYLTRRIPEIRALPNEGTYLVWLDCAGLGLRGRDLEKFMLEKAKVAFCAGYEFGGAGETCLRANLACPRATLTQMLEQVERAVAEQR
ncbi:MAG: pyridoxal phosphate-dependent aminotransferase [Clostridia bacterium]|nr:pyridoxal phosphate-dependent aminotransferase [Clostridia bacterium]